MRTVEIGMLSIIPVPMRTKVTDPVSGKLLRDQEEWRFENYSKGTSCPLPRPPYMRPTPNYGEEIPWYLAELGKHGWEPVSVNYDAHEVLLKKVSE